MEIREGSRRRNNKIIFITAGVIFLLILLSLQTAPDGKVVKVSVGDDSFQVANMLSRERIPFTAMTLEKGEGVVVDYTPVSALARLNKKTAGSRYEIYFAEGKVAAIVWRDQQGKELGRRLFVKLVAAPET